MHYSRNNLLFYHYLIGLSLLLGFDLNWSLRLKTLLLVLSGFTMTVDLSGFECAGADSMKEEWSHYYGKLMFLTFWPIGFVLVILFTLSPNMSDNNNESIYLAPLHIPCRRLWVQCIGEKILVEIQHLIQRSDRSNDHQHCGLLSDHLYRCLFYSAVILRLHQTPRYSLSIIVLLPLDLLTLLLLDSSWYLDKLPDITCFDSQHNGMNIFALVFSALYIVGEPIFALCLYFYWLRKRGKLKKEGGKGMNWFGTLYTPYRRRYAWWEILGNIPIHLQICSFKY